MNVISIDFSKKCTGIYCIFESIENVIEIKNKKTDSQEEVLKKIFNRIIYHLEDHNYDCGLIEGYAFNPKNRRSMIPMSEIGGIIKLAFTLNNIPLISVPVGLWKSQTIGTKYNKYKKNYLYDIHSIYGKKFDSIDAADAYLIYVAVKKIAGRTKYITEPINKIRTQLKQIIKDKKDNGS